MSSVYLVVTQTGSLLSATLKFITGKEYNHVSISLNEDLEPMYSFGRKWPYNPFIGVFVLERINYGTYKRFDNTKCKVIELSVTDQQYLLLKTVIDEFINNRDDYKYDVLGLFLAGINVRYQRDNKFYCSSFVKYVLLNAGIDVDLLPDITHPSDFFDLGGDVLYEGKLNDYKRKVK